MNYNNMDRGKEHAIPDSNFNIKNKCKCDSECRPDCKPDCKKGCCQEEHKHCHKQCQGGLDQIQGDLCGVLGDQSQTQGNLNEVLGDQSQTQGDLSEAQGDQSQTQGNQTETLGDLNQIQGGETQGDQIQGDQTQTQGEQIQTLTGHGGQTLGDQTLLNAPSVSAPVNVSGVNLNITVHCQGKENKKGINIECKRNCQDIIAGLLRLIQTLQLSVTVAEDARIEFFYSSLAATSVTGNLINVNDSCTFIIMPEAGGNPIYVTIDAVEALVFTKTEHIPSLFSVLQNYLQMNIGECGCDSCHDCCLDTITAELQNFQTTNALVQISTKHTQFTGYIFRIKNGIVYLVDDLENQIQIIAIPICKIVSYQQQEAVEG